MRIREVVTAFLECDGRVLIVRRSGRVGSYQGRWSGISGYLEGDPLAHALVEIREETGLPAEQVTLVRQAPPLEIADPGSDTLWRVHPFLFSTHTPQHIRLDWENDDLLWIAPDDIGQFPTVPALAQTLDACLGRVTRHG